MHLFDVLSGFGELAAIFFVLVQDFLFKILVLAQQLLDLVLLSDKVSNQRLRVVPAFNDFDIPIEEFEISLHSLDLKLHSVVFFYNFGEACPVLVPFDFFGFKLSNRHLKFYHFALWREL